MMLEEKNHIFLVWCLFGIPDSIFMNLIIENVIMEDLKEDG